MTIHDTLFKVSYVLDSRDFYAEPLTNSEISNLTYLESTASELIELLKKTRDADAAAREKRLEANREKFMVTLGVNYEGSREAVYEIVFDSLLEAVQIAANARGIVAEHLTEKDTGGHLIEQVTSVPEGALHEVIRGATVEVFTDESGAITEYDLY